jgi:hypothetical protein
MSMVASLDAALRELPEKLSIKISLIILLKKRENVLL